jgi:hypothetical protein
MTLLVTTIKNYDGTFHAMVHFPLLKNGIITGVGKTPAEAKEDLKKELVALTKSGIQFDTLDLEITPS